jgi:hypothetical protein
MAEIQESDHYAIRSEFFGSACYHGLYMKNNPRYGVEAGGSRIAARKNYQNNGKSR